MANLPKHIMRDQAFDQATKEIIIAWENEVSIRLEN
jgi:hypothetical protein